MLSFVGSLSYSDILDDNVKGRSKKMSCLKDKVGQVLLGCILALSICIHNRPIWETNVDASSRPSQLKRRNPDICSTHYQERNTCHSVEIIPLDYSISLAKLRTQTE